MRVLPLISLLCVAAYGLASDSLSDLEIRYNIAVANGLREITFATQFDRMFPSSKHFISYYMVEGMPPIWNSKIGLHGRYVLTMKIPLRIDRSTNRVSAVGQPTFYLNEVASVARLPDGRVRIQYGGEYLRFGEEEWKRLLQHHGDLSALGIHPKINSPISGFESQWEGA